MEMRSAIRLVVVGVLLPLPGASAGSRYDGDWVTHLACEAQGETPAYKFEFPGTIKDGVFHGQHGEEGGPGYLVIDGKIADDGSAKLEAKGHVTQNHAHGVFAVKGNTYSYNIKAHFDEIKGTGTRGRRRRHLGPPLHLRICEATARKPGPRPGGIETH
jgi:hypothetical protein